MERSDFFHVRTITVRGWPDASIRAMLNVPAAGLGLLLAAALSHVELQAQVLPGPVPGVALPRAPLPRVGTTIEAADRTFQSARRLANQALVRRHGEVLETDSRGEPFLRNQILATSPSAAALARAVAEGFTVLQETRLTGLDLTIVTLAPLPGYSTARALKLLRRLDPAGAYDFNHVYSPSGDPSRTTGDSATHAVDVTDNDAGPRVGLVDAGVSATHPALTEARIHRWGCDGRVAPSPHGTAVASLLVGRAPRFSGVIPAGTLYAADVYCGLPTGGNALAVATALTWLAEENVPVINVSLVGPPDVTLERVVARLVARGQLIVAAVGNDGPVAPPLYPAAYPGVIGVTGVNARDRVLAEAARGPHVAFAAPGADMMAADDRDGYADVRGTSFAAPIVAGLLADAIGAARGTKFQDQVASLAGSAIDLGRAGPDETYGAGLVGSRFRVTAARMMTTRGR